MHSVLVHRRLIPLARVVVLAAHVSQQIIDALVDLSPIVDIRTYQQKFGWDFWTAGESCTTHWNLARPSLTVDSLDKEELIGSILPKGSITDPNPCFDTTLNQCSHYFTTLAFSTPSVDFPLFSRSK